MAVTKYRKRPVEVDAVRNDGIWKTIIGWLDELASGGYAIPFGSRPAITRNEDGSLNVETKEGVMRAEVGDWLILEPFPTADRQFYPCKPDIFAATYEVLDDDGEPVLTCEACGEPAVHMDDQGIWLCLKDWNELLEEQTNT